MSGAVLHSHDELHAPADVALHDARESLAYWEDRADRLPRRAVRQRREAREMATRWQHRVAEAERDAYGRGLMGMLVLLAAEGRLPAPARGAGRRVVRRGTQIAVAVVATAIALLVMALVAGVALLSAFLDGLL
jgi:hypothetical protein